MVSFFALQPSTVQDFTRKFFEAALALPVSGRYLSMSGKYCTQTREASSGCKLNKLREFPLPTSHD
jgi:hypothetical protein